MEIPRISLARSNRIARMCFGCGEANPIGLKLKFHQEGDAAVAEYVPGENHQGWDGYVHGGILMSVADEAAGWITILSNIYSVTASIQIRIKSMARIGEPLIVTARITRQTKRIVETEVNLKKKDGTVIAEATSTQFVVNAVVKGSGTDASG